MKNINELSDKEIIKLSNEDLELMIKFKQAQAGIKIIEKPVEPKYKDLPKPDISLYQVKGYEYLFTSEKIALGLANFLREHSNELRKSEFGYNTGYEYKFSSKLSTGRFGDQVSIEAVSLYSKEVFDGISEVIAENKKLKDIYDNEKKQYDENREEVKAIESEIWDCFHEARERVENQEKMLERFKEYLVLAENNQKMAWAFLEKAYTLDESVKDYIKVNISNSNTKVGK